MTSESVTTLEPTGDRMASMMLVSHAIGAMERMYSPGARRRGPRNPGYVPFDAGERVRGVLALDEAEQTALRRISETEGVSASLREKRVGRLTRHFHREHMNLFLDRMVAQRMCLADMQVRARDAMERAMINENGETLADVLERAGGYREAVGGIRREATGELLPRSSYDELFPEGSFRIAEHNITAASLYRLVDETAQTVHLPSVIVADYRAMYGTMVRHSKNVDAFRRDHPNDRKLFRACFGFFPKGDIQIVQGPFGLYIRCMSLDDYAKAYVDSRGGKPATARQLRRVGRTSGVALGSRDRFPEQVRLGLTLEQNDDERLFLGDALGVYGHEEDHVYQRFFTAGWMNVRSTFPSTRSQTCVTENPRELSRAYMSDALEICRMLEIEPDGKDEMLARYRQGEEPIEICDTLLETGPGGFYDFVGRHREDIRATGATKASPFTVGRLMRRHIDEPYQRSVQRAAAALEQLAHLEPVYGREAFSELLRTVPLEQWPRMVRHLLSRL